MKNSCCRNESSRFATKDVFKFWSLLLSNFKSPRPVPLIECCDSFIFGDSDKAEKFRDYSSSVYENDDGIKLFLNRISLSVFDRSDSDVADVFGLLVNLIDMRLLLMICPSFCLENLLLS